MAGHFISSSVDRCPAPPVCCQAYSSNGRPTRPCPSRAVLVHCRPLAPPAHPHVTVDGMRRGWSPLTLIPGLSGSPLEALHPVDCADRAVLSNLGQAVDLAQAFPHEQVGVVVDTSHLRWDPAVWRSIERAGSHVPTSSISDRFPPLPADVLPARGSTGEGSIDVPPVVTTDGAAGHRGDVEV